MACALLSMNCTNNLSIAIGATAAQNHENNLSIAITERAPLIFSIAIAVLPMMHAAADFLVRSWTAKPISAKQRVVASHHLVQLLLGVLLLPLMIEAARRLMLCQPEESAIDIAVASSVAVCVMYSLELAASHSVRPLIAFHHILTLGFLINTFAVTDELTVMVTFVFITGALGKAPTFAGLLLYRFRAGRERLAWWALVVGVVTFGLAWLGQLMAHVAVLAVVDLKSFPAWSLLWATGCGGLLELTQLCMLLSLLHKVIIITPPSASTHTAPKPNHSKVRKPGDSPTVLPRSRLSHDTTSEGSSGMSSANSSGHSGTAFTPGSSGRAGSVFLPEMMGMLTPRGQQDAPYASARKDMPPRKDMPTLRKPAPPDKDSPPSTPSEGFKAAAALVKGLSSVSHADELRLHGLFMQATAGDAPSSFGGSLFDFENSRRWDAWAAVRELGKEEAMRRYCELVDTLSPATLETQPPAAAVSEAALAAALAAHVSEPASIRLKPTLRRRESSFISFKGRERRLSGEHIHASM